MALAVVFRFLAAGLYVFLAGVVWGRRRTPPAGPTVLTLLIAMALWSLAWPKSLHPLGWAAAAIAGGCMLNLIRLASPSFALTLGGLFVAWSLGLAMGLRSLPSAIASAAIGAYLAGAFYWKQTFGLALTHRSLFAVALGVFAALYLFVVRLAAGVIGPNWTLELALLFGAGLLWIPVYAWISSFLSRRANVAEGFSRSIFEDASRILDVGRRMEFLSGQVASRFRTRNAVLVWGARQAPQDVSIRPAYRFPLHLEGREYGALLLDPGPRKFRDDEESLLRSIAPQIAQSLESARLIEEKIALERELARKENLAEMGRAAAAIAHEIKNPLSAIKTLVQLMRENPDTAEAHGDSLEFITSEIDRLDWSLRQLLGYARTPPELNQTVDLTRLLKSLAASVNIPASFEIEPGLAVSHSNEELLRQVILNLLLNASQAAQSEVVVKAARAATGIEISVSDDGPGIPAELREKVFAPFFTTKQRGTGLGLAIVRNNVERLGGRILLECPPEGGTTVTVRL